MGLTTSKQNCGLDDGTYRGVWGGYTVTLDNGFAFHVPDGIRTPNAPVIVKVGHGVAVVQTVDESQPDTRDTGNTEGEEEIVTGESSLHDSDAVLTPSPEIVAMQAAIYQIKEELWRLKFRISRCEPATARTPSEPTSVDNNDPHDSDPSNCEIREGEVPQTLKATDKELTVDPKTLALQDALAMAEDRIGMLESQVQSLERSWQLMAETVNNRSDRTDQRVTVLVARITNLLKRIPGYLPDTIDEEAKRVDACLGAELRRLDPQSRNTESETIKRN